jgi:hypothetical protein
MKIDTIQSGHQTLPQTATSPAAESESFHKLLQSRIEQSVKAQQVKAAAPADFIAKASPELRIEGLSLTETTLSTLDSYGQALANLSYSAEELEPFIAGLEEETAALIELKQEFSPEDPLAKLLDRVATVSYLESAKYRRGDYRG